MICFCPIFTFIAFFICHHSFPTRIHNLGSLGYLEFYIAKGVRKMHAVPLYSKSVNTKAVNERDFPVHVLLNGAKQTGILHVCTTRVRYRT